MWLSALHEIYTVAILKGDEEPPASAAIHEALEKQFPGITQAHINDAGCLITVRGYVEKGRAATQGGDRAHVVKADRYGASNLRRGCGSSPRSCSRAARRLYGAAIGCEEALTKDELYEMAVTINETAD